MSLCRRVPCAVVRLMLLFALTVAAGRARADAPHPGDLLVGVGQVIAGTATNISTLYEFDANNTLVQSFAVPQVSDDATRGFAVNPAGHIAVYNGTFAPVLSVYDPATNTWTASTFDGWSTVNNVTYGATAWFGPYVFATDCATAASGGPTGLVRFDTHTGTAERFGDSADTISLTVGQDHLLYAIDYGGFTTHIRVFNPLTLEAVRTLDLPQDSPGDSYRSLAVNAAGDLFTVGLDGIIYHYDAQGHEINHVSCGATYAVNLALSDDGHIAVAREDGYVALTDETLNHVTTFKAVTDTHGIDWSVFVAWAPHHNVHCDFNGDGKADLLWQNTQTNATTAWLMSATLPTGTLNALTPGQVPTEWHIVAALDWNGDGKTDLVWQHQQTNQVVVWYLDGVNSTAAVSVVAPNVVTPPNRLVSVADFNGDGKPDLLWQNSQTNSLEVWYLGGTDNASVIGKATLAADYAIPAVWTLATTIDLDGDGKTDLVWRNTQSGDVVAWFLDGITPTRSILIAPGIDTTWNITGGADLDGDSKPYLLWRNGQSGDVYGWKMQGATYLSGSLIYAGVSSQWQIVGLR